MQLHELLEKSYTSFKQHLPNARVILLHPQSRYRSLLVAQLIETPEINTFYYAMGPDDINLQSFLSGVTHDLANQHPTFGRHLNMLPADSYNDTEVLLATFARDLSELHDDEFLFILDEYDRSDSADDVQMFVEKLASHLPEHCRLVINSRTLPRLPWVSMIAQSRAKLLLDDGIIRDNFYNINEEGEDNLEVYALGPGFVLLNHEAIDTWEGHLPRLLFFFALDRPVITRSEICQAFWPELDTDQAVNVFHVTKRRLHKALDMDVLVHEGGYYRVNPEFGIHYDVMNFVSYLMLGRDKNNPDRMHAWQRAIDIYRGPFLQGHSDGWILDRRRDFLAGYLEALMEMSTFRIEQGRKEHALSLLHRALTADSSREDIHREVMKLFTHLGRRSEAAAHYQKFLDDMKALKQTPSAETQTLYQEIMA
jgi:DNA-binding SARP family transcriptional activator